MIGGVPVGSVPSLESDGTERRCAREMTPLLPRSFTSLLPIIYTLIIISVIIIWLPRLTPHLLHPGGSL
ncbi:hypothetical protein D9C73_003619 [Collichthys lucidus]|uniref:Uncharacterized protein n=1 Tax=Collichthys lucidus TaxID=240159 RepID=A0A4U5U5N2_COLLU|nr:hypothetical protein D9C73_003619 [Collichthys lucidus]